MESSQDMLQKEISTLETDNQKLINHNKTIAEKIDSMFLSDSATLQANDGESLDNLEKLNKLQDEFKRKLEDVDKKLKIKSTELTNSNKDISIKENEINKIKEDISLLEKTSAQKSCDLELKLVNSEDELTKNKSKLYDDKERLKALLKENSKARLSNEKMGNTIYHLSVKYTNEDLHLTSIPFYNDNINELLKREDLSKIRIDNCTFNNIDFSEISAELFSSIMSNNNPEKPGRFITSNQFNECVLPKGVSLAQIEMEEKKQENVEPVSSVGKATAKNLQMKVIIISHSNN